MAEEVVQTEPFGLRGDDQHIWHIAAGERWSDGTLVGYRTACGRNYPPVGQRGELDGLDDVCSDCKAQVSQRH